MKRWYLLLIIFIPLVIFANVFQVFRYKNLESEIEKLHTEQNELVEKNKRLIAGIAVLRSPRRLERIAAENLGLDKPGPGRIIRIFLPKKDESSD